MAVRFYLLLCALIVLLAGLTGPVCSEIDPVSAPIHPYSPFDEPKPKIPEEILSDTRLDQHVKVAVKSENIRDLFAELTKLSGVKIRCTREISGERPIVYFHDRALRDVMTEISGLYGYYWLVKGKPGAYSYELFEDIRHARRREEAKKDRRNEQDSLLMALLDKCSQGTMNAEELQRLAGVNPKVYRQLTDEFTGRFLSFYTHMDRSLVRKALAEDRLIAQLQGLPSDFLTAICTWRNGVRERRNVILAESGQSQEEFTPWTPTQLAGGTLMLNRISKSPFMVPYLRLTVNSPDGVIAIEFPPWEMEETDFRALAEWEIPATVVGDTELPDKPEIKLTDLRIVQNGSMLLGEVLKEAAEQSERDIIADYYFQEAWVPPMTSGSLRTLVPEVCKGYGYSCHVDSSTLRFRFNDWQMVSAMQEPPANLLETWWTKLERAGRLDIWDLLDIAALPQEQMRWPGFRFIPGAGYVRRNPITFGLWRSLDMAQMAAASQEGGLPAHRLATQQQRQLVQWMDTLKIDVPENDLASSVLTLAGPGFGTSAQQDEPYSQVYTFALRLPNGRECPIQLTMPPRLSQEERKALAAQRQADREADSIELVIGVLDGHTESTESTGTQVRGDDP